MKFVCEFYGGHYNGRQIPVELAEKATEARSRSWASERAAGRLVPRAELDSRPVFEGYLGPIFDGLRYQVGWKTYYDFEVERSSELKARVEREGVEPYAVLRYETQDVYDTLSR